jgi:hypothetical protein
MSTQSFVSLSAQRLILRAAATALLFASALAPVNGAELTGTPISVAPSDIKTIPGNGCQAYGVIATFLTWQSYALTNTYTGRSTVVCPIVRDNALNTNGTASVAVNVYNPAAGGEFECKLVSYSRYGASLATDTASTTEEGNQTINLDVDVSESLGYYVLTCFMPPSGPRDSKIYSYTYREHPATHGETQLISQPLP